ncbi:MAG: DUF3592 domain-containing protein [Bryobacteraceae bacterium]
MSAADKAPGRPAGWGVVVVALAYLFALFTAFAAVVSAAEVWGEFRHGQWPAASARVERCDVKPYRSSTGRRLEHSAYYIACAISYETARAQLVTATLKSRRIQSPELTWPDTGPKIREMQSWVDRHPAGAILKVHYDPANQRDAVLTSTDMPFAGPQTTNNLKLVLVCAGAWAVLSRIGKAVRRQAR